VQNNVIVDLDSLAHKIVCHGLSARERLRAKYSIPCSVDQERIKDLERAPAGQAQTIQELEQYISGKYPG
jgi:hypothetical protein